MRHLPDLLTVVFVVLLAGAVHAAERALDPRLAQAEALYRTEGPEAALPEFERIAADLQANGDEFGYAVALGMIGECHWRLGNFEQAGPILDDALTRKRALGDRGQEARTLNVTGLLAWHRGDYPAAIEKFEATAAIAREIGDSRLEGAALNNRSLVGDELGDYETSLGRYREALDLFRAADFPRGEGDVLGNIGGVNLLLGRFREAERYYRQALAISEQQQSVMALSQDHGNLAMSLLGQGRTGAALEEFDMAARFAADAGMGRDVAYWQRGKANALSSRGDHDAAIALYRAAIKTYAEIGADPEQVEALFDLGQLYLTLGDAASARAQFDESLELARRIGLARAVTLNLLATGDLALREGDLATARNRYNDTLVRAREAGELGIVTESLLRLAATRLTPDADTGPDSGTGDEHVSRREAAAAYAREALDIARQTGARRQEARALFLLGESSLPRDPKSALAVFDAAGPIAEAAGDPELSWQIHYGRARALMRDARQDAAIDELLAAIAIIESVRERLREQRFRAGYLQDKTQVYVELARLQLRQGYAADAFSTAQRLRASAYLDLVERQDTHDSADSASATNAREIEARERIRQLERAIDDEEAREAPERRERAIATFSRALAEAEREYETLLDDRRRSPDPFGRLAAPITYESLQANLQPGQALLEYLVDRDAVLAFIVTPDALTVRSIAVERRDLVAKIELLRDLLGQPDNDLWMKPAASLAELLIRSLDADAALRSVNTLYLVPHAELNYLPFAVLPDGDALLVDRFTLSYLPSATTLTLEHKEPDEGPNILVLAPASTRLKHAHSEAAAIDALFQPNSRLLDGAAATETAFRAHAPGYRNLHLATHGFFNRQTPLLSGLELEPDTAHDGRVEVHEILGLDLTAELVTLSACDTGLGSGLFDDVPAGDDFVSLTRAFIYAGSNAVLASLWEVDDRSTELLMTGFYRHLTSGDKSVDKATALAQAQRELRERPDYTHPYFWAAFVLVGDTRELSRSATPEGGTHS